jgi:transposase, IS5 family
MTTLLTGYETQRRLTKNRLMEIKELIDWRKIEERLKGVVTPLEERGGGPRGYSGRSLFLAMLLGQWHELSDRQLEEALRVRLDFMAFAELELGEEVPDETTLCRFRNRLVAEGKIEGLLKLVNRQLEGRGLKVEQAKGALIDATIIWSASRPQGRKEESEENREEASKQKKIVDAEAAWLKKGEKYYYGYRVFARNESRHGYVEQVESEPANVSEMTYLEKMCEQVPPQTRVYTDKGSSSAENVSMLKQRGLKNGIMRKAARNRKLRSSELKWNKLIGKLRYKVEQGFGIMKSKLGMHRARYLGKAKMQMQATFAAIGMNLIKAVNWIRKTKTKVERILKALPKPLSPATS